MSGVPKPTPVPDDRSAPFWAATATHDLAMQRCDVCDWYAYPPNISCTNCRADPPAFHWEHVSGSGRVKTWTVIRDAFLPGFADDVPYVVADVELPEQPGLRIAARLVGVGIDDVRLGLEVTVAFGETVDGAAVPHFVAKESL